jgi:hypothetical protein
MLRKRSKSPIKKTRTLFAKKAATFSGELFFGQKPIRFRKTMMKNLPTKSKKKWDEFMKTRLQLQKEGIPIILIPRKFDKRHGYWWADYASHYIKELYPKYDDLYGDYEGPVLDMYIDLDDKNHYLSSRGLYMNFSNLKGEDKKIFLNIMKDKSWFEWNGLQNKAMKINL